MIQIHTDRKQISGGHGGVGWAMAVGGGALLRTADFFMGRENTLELDSGDGCTALNTLTTTLEGELLGM